MSTAVISEQPAQSVVRQHIIIMKFDTQRHVVDFIELIYY